MTDCPFAKQNADLKEQVARLAGELSLLKPPKALFLFPKSWKLTPSERRVLGSLYASATHMRTHTQLKYAAVVKPNVDGFNLHNGYIFSIRKKTGLSIENVRGLGFRLPPKTVETIRKALSDAV